MMRRKKPRFVGVFAMAVLGVFIAAPFQAMAQAVARRTASPAAVSSATSGTSKGMAAVAAAAQESKYLFIFFWKANDEQNRAMFGVFQSAMNKWEQSANSVGIQITDPNEKPLVDKLDVSRAPMPLVVALAPNGAVTKGFPVKFTEQQLQQAFVSPCTARCLKALQDRKLVLLCVQNERTQFSQAAWRGAQDFKADARYAKATEVVALNPEDQAETAFLRDLKVDPRTAQAVTVVLAPPGQPVASFVGAVTKDQIVAKVASAKSGPCAGGKCGPGGCCPPKK